jgi:ABC-type enterochelin transport system permease subunit
MQHRDVIARVVAFACGILGFFIAGLVIASLQTNSLAVPIAVDIATYTVLGALLGFIWPASGWRLGLYLFAIWLPIIIINFFFSDRPAQIHWRQELFVGLGFLMILPGACIGAFAGSTLRSVLIRTRTSDEYRT